jgi:hypothetical protein
LGVTDADCRPRGKAKAVGAVLHRATLFDEDLTTRDGVSVRTVPRTVVDLARSVSIRAAVVTLDAALHTGATTPDAVLEVMSRCWNWPGIRRAGRAVRLSDARSESPLESISRLVMRRLRLPTPTLRPRIFSSNGSFIGRVDFYSDEFGVVGEADGDGKYDLLPTSLFEEKRRQEELENQQLGTARWGGRRRLGNRIDSGIGFARRSSGSGS